MWHQNNILVSGDFDFLFYFFPGNSFFGDSLFIYPGGLYMIPIRQYG